MKMELEVEFHLFWGFVASVSLVYSGILNMFLWFLRCSTWL